MNGIKNKKLKSWEKLQKRRRLMQLESMRKTRDARKREQQERRSKILEARSAQMEHSPECTAGCRTSSGRVLVATDRMGGGHAQRKPGVESRDPGGPGLKLFTLRESRRGDHELCEHGSDRRETSAKRVSDDLQFSIF